MPASMPGAGAARADRFHALDAVRAMALLLGLALHATVSFFPPGDVAIWPVVDRASSHSLGLVFYVIHTFRMLLFFLLAGFFARVLVERDGLRLFFRRRAKRVLMPLVVGLITLLPLTMALASIFPQGMLVVGRLPQFMHLWFLYLLLWFYALIGAAIVLHRMTPTAVQGLLQSAGDRLVDSPWLPLVAAVPGAVALYSLPFWAVWFGIPPAGVVPNRAAMVGYGTAVLVGWLMHRRLAAMRALERRSTGFLILAVLCTAACLAIVGVRPRYTPAPEGLATATYAVLYSAAGWSWALAVIGVGLRTFALPNRTVRYIADAAYWVYLAHLPLILLFQAAVATSTVHWTLKFTSVVVGPLALLFGSYHLYVVVKRWPLRNGFNSDKRVLTGRLLQ